MKKLLKALSAVCSEHVFLFISDGAIPYGSCLSNDALFKIQSDVIRELAEKQSCLFVGRCADYILRDHPRCVNIFVSASKEARIERLMHIHHISTEAAEELMEKADKKRSAYYNYYSYKTWGLPKLITYALIRPYWGLMEQYNSSNSL